MSPADLREVLEHHAGMRAIVEGPDLAAGSLLGERVIVTNPGSGRQWAGYGYAQAWHPTIVIQDGNGFQRTLPLAWARRAANEPQLSPVESVDRCPSWRWIDGGNDTVACEQPSTHGGKHTHHGVPPWTTEDAKRSDQFMNEEW